MNNDITQYKKVNVALLQDLISVIVNSNTNLTFLQVQSLVEQVQNSEDIVEEVETSKKTNTTNTKEKSKK